LTPSCLLNLQIQSRQRRLQAIDHGHQKRQIEGVDRIAGLVIVGIAHEGGVGNHHGVVARIQEGAVIAEPHIGKVVAGIRYWRAGPQPIPDVMISKANQPGWLYADD